MLYFKHQSNMRNDVKVRRLIAKHGIEGYGLYCLILESIAESLSNESPTPDLQENLDDIANFYNGNIENINKIMEYILEQKLLSLSDEGTIICHKLYKFLDTSQTRSEKLREMIKSYKGTTYASSQTVSDKYERKEEKRREEKRKEEKENKEKEFELHNSTPPFLLSPEGKKKKERKRKRISLSFIADDNWKELYMNWTSNKIKPYKTQAGVKAGFKRLKTISENNIEVATAIINKSLSMEWQGLFPLDEKEKIKGRIKPTKPLVKLCPACNHSNLKELSHCSACGFDITLSNPDEIKKEFDEWGYQPYKGVEEG